MPLSKPRTFGKPLMNFSKRSLQVFTAYLYRSRGHYFGGRGSTNCLPQVGLEPALPVFQRLKTLNIIYLFGTPELWLEEMRYKEAQGQKIAGRQKFKKNVWIIPEMHLEVRIVVLITEMIVHYVI